MVIERLTFEEILTIWQSKLWPNRQSKIESHSAMTWPFEGDPGEYDMRVFDYPATFWGVKIDNKLVSFIDQFKTKVLPTMPISAKVLMEKYDVSEGKSLGDKLKIIEEEWVNNDFQIKDEKINKIINS